MGMQRMSSPCDSWVENLQAPLDALISRLLELNRKQQDELQEVVQLHRHALEALERPVVVHDSLGSYEFPPSEGARGELEVRGDLEDLRPQKPNLPDEEAETCRFQPLSSTFCTKQPSAPDDDDALCRKAESFEPLEQRTNSTARDLSERLEDSRSERVSTWTTSRTPGELATSSAAKDLKLAQERRNGFDTAIGILVLLNAFVMVLDLECQGNQAGLDAGIIGLNVWSGFEPAINVMEHCFAVAFLLELCYRVYSERCKYFKEGMNIFDTVLVAVACIDLYILTPLLATSSFNNTSTLRLLRTVKLVRAVRIVRALRLFRGLRLLIKACSSFLPSLCWSMALLGLFMMMGALFMGNLLQDYILDESLDRDRRTWVWMHYGTAYRAIYTMFEMTFAGNWPVYARPVLEYVGHGFVIFYLLYITFVVFAVIRVISAIFLRETLEAANNDAEMLVQDRLHKKSTYVRKLEGIFAACDESGDGVLTENELTELMRDPRVQVYLESLEIDVRESTALFRLLQNSEGVICCDDFIDGILRCKGPARAIDQILLANDVKQVSEQVKKLTGLLNDAGVITGGAFTKKHVKRNLSDELALLPSMHATLSGRYILT